MIHFIFAWIFFFFWMFIKNKGGVEAVTKYGKGPFHLPHATTAMYLCLCPQIATDSVPLQHVSLSFSS